MIETALPNLILIPLTFNLLIILGWWLLYNLWELRRYTPPARARIYRCAVCKHVYVDARDMPLARCSRCGCLNEAVKR